MGQRRLNKLTPVYRELEQNLGSDYSRVTLNKSTPKSIPYPRYLHHEKTHTKGVSSDLVILFASESDKLHRGERTFQDHSIGFSHNFKNDEVMVRVGVQLKGQPKGISYSPSLPQDVVIAEIKAALKDNYSADSIIESLYKSLVLGNSLNFKPEIESARAIETQSVEAYFDSPEISNIVTNVHASINDLTRTTSVALELRELIKNDLELTSEYKLVNQLEKQLEEARKSLSEKRKQIEAKHKGRLNARETIYKGQEAVTHYADDLVKRLSCDYKSATGELRAAIKSTLIEVLTKSGIATKSPSNWSHQYYLKEAGLVDVVVEVTKAVNESIK